MRIGFDISQNSDSSISYVFRDIISNIRQLKIFNIDIIFGIWVPDSRFVPGEWSWRCLGCCSAGLPLNLDSDDWIGLVVVVGMLLVLSEVAALKIGVGPVAYRKWWPATPGLGLRCGLSVVGVETDRI